MALREQSNRWIQQAKQSLSDAPFDLKLLAGLDILIHEVSFPAACERRISAEQFR